MMAENPFNCRIFSVANGLRSNVVNQTIQDPDGYIWIGTREGLMRFDGDRLVDFTKPVDLNANNTDPNIGILKLDPNENLLWMRTSDSDMLCLDLSTYEYITPEKEGIDDIEKAWMEASLPEQDGYKFVENGVHAIDIVAPDGTVTTLRLIPDDNGYFNKMHRFSIAKYNDMLYISTYGAGFYTYNISDKKLEHYTSSSSNPIITTDFLTHCFMDSNHNVWICSEGGGLSVLRIHDGNVGISVVGNSHGMSGGGIGRVTFVERDPVSDELLFTSRTGKAYFFNPDDESMKPTGLDALQVFKCALTDKQGHKWYGSDNGFMIDGHKFLNVESATRQPRYVNYVSDLACDGQGRVWAATRGGLRLMDYSGGNLKEAAVALEDDGFICKVTGLLYLPEYGRMYVATRGGMFFINCADLKSADMKSVRNALHRIDVPAVQITAVERGADNSLWIGTKGNGVLKASIANGNPDDMTFETIDSNRGLNGSNVVAIKDVGDGNVVVGLEYGVAMINGNTLLASTHVPFSNPLSNMVICNNIADKNDKVIIGTADGLMVIDKTQVKSNVASVEHSPMISGLMVNGHPVYKLNGPLEFSHRDNSIQFLYSGILWNDDERVLYQYRLDGNDKDWLPITTGNSVFYDNLSPGKYTFRVRMLGTDGQWSEEDALEFRINGPWWFSWWAWLIYLAVIGVAGYIIYRTMRYKFSVNKQIREIEKQEKTKTEFFAAMTNEFRTPLAVIDSAARNVTDENGTISQTNLQTINRSVKRLLRLVNDFMDFSKLSTGTFKLNLQKGDLVAFIRDLYFDFRISATQKEITINITSFQKAHEMYFDRRVVETVVYNLLSNALKFTPRCGEVKIIIKRDDNDMIHIVVEDTGPGVPKDKVDTLFSPFAAGDATGVGSLGVGLSNAHQLAQIHHGDITYQYRPGGGSILTFTIPASTEVYSSAEFNQHEASRAKVVSREDVYREIKELNPDGLRNRTIAIVEEDEDLIAQITNSETKIFKVVAYRSAKEAMANMEKDRPEVVVCDVMLPDGSGYSLVGWMKSHPEMRDVPVIMLSSLVNEKLLSDGYSAGADDYMGKPCNYPLLVLRTAQLMRWADEKNLTSGFSNDETDEANRKVMDAKLLERFEKIVRNGISMPDFNVVQVAEKLHLGRTSFYGKIRELTGMTPGKYVNKIRMEMALDMIKKGNRDIAHICRQIGISDHDHFTRLFASYYGVELSKFTA